MSAVTAPAPIEASRLPAGIDPVRLEVIKNGLLAMTEEQGVALYRAAYSTNIKTRRDYSCSFLDRDLRGVAQALAQPSHLAAMKFAIPAAIEMYGIDRLRPGDGILSNIPHLGSTHLNDIALISPFFWEGKLFGFFVNFAHHVDVGGAAPGSLAMGSEIYQEGVVIPPIRFVRDGQIDRDCYDLLRWNVRSGREMGGDLGAQLASNNVGAQRLAELLERHGAEELSRYVDALLDYTEVRSRQELRCIPEGVYAADSFLDPDDFNPQPTRVALTLTVAAGRVTVDLTGSAGQLPNSLNGTIGVTFAGVAYALRCLLSDDIPVNDGFYRSFDLIAPEGTVANAQFPAGVIAGTEIGLRCVDLIFKALSEVLPDRVTACCKGTLMQVAFGTFDPRRGEASAYYETIGGGEGARAHRPGQHALQTHIQNTENAPIEEIEASYPVRIAHYGLRKGSGGAGAQPGGEGIRRDFAFPHGPARFTILADRCHEAPWGLAGGEAGAHAEFVVIRDGVEHPSTARAVIDVAPGDIVSIRSPGGGGFGHAASSSNTEESRP
ncbi:hydantoinase B/oxoprolinase family protein [Novosphingobium resinovorum]|uniref:hydantoinase B/oxoprolinase family protein n=1 Tax=Novosphingobium resinovorum TaxID=158500 RepID=UPI002ED32196|nr:hydantoinase B/oxoprolinase family protein [Novosphingobium resinovorum]